MMKRFMKLFSLLLVLGLFTGCGDGRKEKCSPGGEKSDPSTRSQTETTDPPASSSRKEPDPEKTQDGGEASRKNEKTQDGGEDARETEKQPARGADGRQPEGQQSRQRRSASEGTGGETTPSSQTDGGGSRDERIPGGQRSASGSDGSDSAPRKMNRSVPRGWVSSDIKKAPAPASQEIWNNIILELEQLTVARRVQFSPLGAAHTSLTDLSGGKYKVCGRCIIVGKNGNQTAYEFEAVAFANKYEASIRSVKFHENDH